MPSTGLVSVRSHPRLTQLPRKLFPSISHPTPLSTVGHVSDGESGGASVGGQSVRKLKSIPAIRVHAFKTAFWIAVAVVVAVMFGVSEGRQRGLEFVTGYIVEYSLSVDNLFVFLLIFKYFKVPREAQETVLFWGILGAMMLRGVMIVAGKVLVGRFEWLAAVFAVVLIYSAVKLLWEDDDDDDDVGENRVIRFSKSVVPVVDRYVGQRFFVVEDGRVVATPLMVVLVAIELSDVVFALDSVPAVLGISKDTLVIYVSNILAIMGLRSLFFVLASSIGNVRFLKQSLAVVLLFIGVKMILGCMGWDVSVALSLAVVIFTLAFGVAMSFLWPAPQSRSSSGVDLAGMANIV
eukprot:GFKZ01000856.1.p2 GENE.GFKZ01000856.1~~GFKZ01000856.1.p2  ORF type:complete len:362 (-),score=58.30 GFKZ01000856.1:197-1246(-)